MKASRKKLKKRNAAPARLVSKRSAPKDAFDQIFSHSGALAIVKIANREIKAAKARLRALGIDPEDPPAEAEDPDYRLS